MSAWNEKRLEILHRDNYTCQVCQQFNPELGAVEFYDPESTEVELHMYTNCPDPFGTAYTISQSKTGYNFSINFGNCWPVFPIMQVHHKKYTIGKEAWDYDNESLLTLCKGCHVALHFKETIPIYSSDNQMLERRMFLPVDLGIGRKHNCDAWTFIERIGGGEYVVANIEPTISMVILDHHNKQDIEKEGKLALDRLIRNFFPRYTQRR